MSRRFNRHLSKSDYSRSIWSSHTSTETHIQLTQPSLDAIIAEFNGLLVEPVVQIASLESLLQRPNDIKILLRHVVMET